MHNWMQSREQELLFQVSSLQQQVSTQAQRHGELEAALHQARHTVMAVPRTPASEG